ncbi:MAG: phosphotransferase [Pseudomonadales bacterium]|nr:phosphotransferase [Pseudomonadales bacterium]
MSIQLPKSIRDNMRFLCVEVDSQVANLQDFFVSPTAALARRILDRSGYAYNLKTRIHGSCVNKLASSKKRDVERLSLRSVEFIATDLERITELGRDCVGEMNYVDDMSCLLPDTYISMLKRVRGGIELVEPAILDKDAKLALQIGQLEDALDQDYNKLLSSYIAALKKRKNTTDLTRGLFLARNVRQMGGVLRHISESIISANLGQPVNFERYYSLQSLVEDLEMEHDLLRIEPIAETRSGSAISGITSAKNKDDYVAIFKDGVKQKVKEERQGVNSWHNIYPGLAPRILSYKKRGESAALLIEHLPGLTFEKILLNESNEQLQETLGQLAGTLKSVWQETRTPQPVNAHFIQQLQKRLPDVYRIHPEFKQSKSNMCGVDVPAFDQLLDAAKTLEGDLKAPFSVYIHGDFNVDNIIYDPMQKRVNFIDLHRSRYMDYVQDVSVFMVSNYRLQILEETSRRRILGVPLDFYSFAKRFAAKSKDETFEIRLALGLARSFATSTRFILDKSLAKSMFFRARYLIELVLGADLDKPKRFKIPLKEIFVD